MTIEEQYAETRRQVRARLYARDWNPIRVGLIARIQSIVLTRGGTVKRWCA